MIEGTKKALLSEEDLLTVAGGTDDASFSEERVGWEYYTVKTGDTLSSVASKFNTTVDAIIRLNPTILGKSGYLTPGMSIKVPKN